jgi:hypothetical protein
MPPMPPMLYVVEPLELRSVVLVVGIDKLPLRMTDNSRSPTRMFLLILSDADEYIFASASLVNEAV